MVAMKENIIILAAAIFLAIGCSKDASEDLRQEEDFVRFSVTTKSGESYTDRTYLAALYKQSAPTTAYFGTYCGVSTHAWCTPCTVNAATGAWTADNISGGLRPQENTNYFFVLASPAVQPTLFTRTSDSSQGYGYHLNRVGGTVGEMQYISGYNIVSTSGIVLGGNYIYPAEESLPIREHRSKLSFRIQCGEDIPYAIFKSISLDSLVVEATYDILKEDFDLETYGTVSVWTGPQTMNQGTAALQIASDVEVFSRDYSKLDALSRYVYAHPKLHLVRVVGETEKDCYMPLVFKMEPHYKYDLTLTLNDINLSVTVTASPWDAVQGSQDIGEYPTYTYTITVPDWASSTDSGTIDDTI